MKTLKSIFLVSMAILIYTVGIAQKVDKEISLDNIYKKGTFRAKSVYGLRSLNNGENYTTLFNGSAIIKYSYKTGEAVDTLFNLNKFDVDFNSFRQYKFSSDESKILIAANADYIYRRSFTADYYIYYVDSKNLVPVSNNGAQRLGTLSPTGDKIAFVRDNNIFIKNFETNTEKQITSDGKYNNIINGATDWVYEEEFALTQGFTWSPKGDKIAFYKFDESKVKQFNMNMFNRQLYPENYSFKYPKAGEDNSIVSIHVYNLNTQKTRSMDIGEETDQYIPRIKWTKDNDILGIIRMNRLQNKVEILLTNSTSGKSKSIYSETNKYYIRQIDDNYFTVLDDGKSFIINSEKDGYNHLYLYNINGKLISQITNGKWDVTGFYGIDEENNTIYYSSVEESPLNTAIYSIELDGSNKKKLSKKEGTNRASFSNGFKYFINYYSNANTPYYITLHNKKGKLIRVLEDNAKLKETIKQYGFSKKEFLTINTPSSKWDLNAYMIKPNNFDENKEYPVFMYLYGGPGSQQVTNSWGRNMAWFQMLAQEGYIVVCVDNRGTGSRGEEFKKMTYGELGKYETIDQIEAAEYFSNLKYIDSKRTGIFGWSYGGFMSSSCLFKGNDVFEMAIAVAPVTNWRYYDSIYTERFMGLPSDNAKGYDDNSPINHVDKLKGKYLLVHGTGDDNVHVQNSIELIEKLVQANKQFEMQFYPDKKHGIYGGNTTYHLYTRMTNFILNNL
ncbi:MAG: S9 family peptidase [Bacteroidales bacterium]|jgi:dipeptidyl-peptidase-4|nr:S9 family peptidase [Bacteroidales bacterium]